MLNIEGLPITTPTLINTQITPNMGNVIRISEQYARVNTYGFAIDKCQKYF